MLRPLPGNAARAQGEAFGDRALGTSRVYLRMLRPYPFDIHKASRCKVSSAYPSEFLQGGLPCWQTG